MPPLVECVPNVSEGRDRVVIDTIAQAISRVDGVRLLDVDPGADTNRTVYTFVGPPDAVAEAAFEVASRCVELIDMRRHRGAHPRIGSMDVCPFVPVADVSMEACVRLAHALGRRVGDELGVPVYFYDRAAPSPARRSLADIRAGEYEQLPAKLQDRVWKPDAGPDVFNARTGAFVIGARDFLLAYNVNLNTTDRRLANEIALTIREGGRLARDSAGAVVVDAEGRQQRVPGRLKAVRAIGWYIEQYGQAQVSINLLDFHATPLHVVFETVREEADRAGLVVTGSELVGVTPLEPMLEAGRYFLRKQGKSAGAPEPVLVETAIRSLGLGQVAPFDPQKKIIEYHFRAAAKLATKTVQAFVDDVSRESPTPGGGSVAALAGSLAAALTSMVANLAVSRQQAQAAREECERLAGEAQRVKDALVSAIDNDAGAFDAVLMAMRMPKGNDEQQAARNRAIAEATMEAARVPLETARLCAEAATLARDVARFGTRTSATDAGVAALAARTGAEGAALNVLTNLSPEIDAGFKDAAAQQAAAYVDAARQYADEVLGIVREALPVDAAWLPGGRGA